MPKLNQIIAVSNGKKSTAKSTLTKVYHAFQRGENYEGLHRTYQPRDDEGDFLPPESKAVQRYVEDDIGGVVSVFTDLFNVVAMQEYNNCNAKAAIVVDGRAILDNVPVTYLLFLEKQLVDLKTFVSKMPTLDETKTWTKTNAKYWSSEAVNTVRTKKMLRTHVKYEATKEHPAQTEVYSEDVIVGDWTKVDHSGAITPNQRDAYLNRIEKLTEAVKMAREEANGLDVEKVDVGKDVFDYVFGK